jgi:dTDP-4-dehydrorhamnose reductase
MLGHKLFQVLPKRFPQTACTVRTAPALFRERRLFSSDQVYDGIDVLDAAAVNRVVEEFRPDVLINAVGLIKQRPLGNARPAAIRINALLPHDLQQAAAAVGARTVHFSTDCVYRGDRGTYVEEDPSDALDVYGRTKYLGELEGPGTLTLRTSIVGRQLRGRESLIEWFVSNESGHVRGFTRALYSGVTTDHLAELVGEVLAAHPMLEGLYHVAGPPISKYELLRLVREVLDLDATIEPDEGFVLDRTLDDRRFREATVLPKSTWKEMIVQMAANPIPYAGRRK